MGRGEGGLELAGVPAEGQDSAADNLGDRRGALGAVRIRKDDPGCLDSQPDTPRSRADASHQPQWQINGLIVPQLRDPRPSD